MKKGLRIGPGITLPLDAVTETIAILSKRGAGKTYTASVLAEEMLAAELQVVVIDPMSAWWGLRSSADGKSEGFPIAVLGGPRGDVPLEATGGPVVADLVVGERVSVIVDVSDFSKGERRRFVTDFLERLYQKNRDPMHVFLEEADLFAPQSGGRGQEENARMLGASYDIVRRGRGRGIGSTLITQRSASISKEVLEQAEILVALRTTGPRDRKAIEGWIDVHGEEDEQDKVMASLPGLPTGTAWVWWPVEGVLKQVKIRERRTFDSSATPKVGERLRRPKTVADVDLGALQAQMKETIERAKAEDPKELHKEIRRLRAELGKRPTETKVEERVEEIRVEVPIFRDGEVASLAKAVDRMADVGAQLQAVGTEVREASDRVASTLEEARNAGKAAPPRPSPTTRQPPARQRPPRTPERPSQRPRPDPVPSPPADGEGGDFTLTGSHRRILNSLAWWESVGVDQPTKIQIGFIAMYRVGRKAGGTFGNRIGELRTASLVEYPAPNRASLTEAGRDEAEAPPIPATTEALQEQVFAQLGESHRRILAVLIEVYPEELHKQDLGERVGYQVGEKVGGTFGNRLGELKSLGLVDYPSPGWAAAAPVLFLEAVPA